MGFSPAAAWVASAHQSDPRLTLWNGLTLDGSRELHGANGHLYALDFSPDGRLVAAAGSQRAVYVWEAHQDTNTITKRTALRLGGHDGRISSLDFSPDGRLLATADREGAVRIWSLRKRPWSQEERALLADAGSDEIWHRLGSTDPAEGFAAVQLLAAHPPQALAMIRRKLKALDAGPPDTVRQWVRDLADGDFEVREKASRRLHPFVSMYRAYFQEVRRDAAVPETRHRIGRLLRGESGSIDPTKALRRAVHVLEWIQGPEAVTLIRQIGRKPVAAQAAQAALHRLGIPDKNENRPRP